MQYRIVFSDVDGTLLDSGHRVLPSTLEAIARLRERGIPFVINSGRSPSGIYPIFEENHFRCPIISYNGALAVDENREVVFSVGISQEVAAKVISFVEANRLDCSWNIYSLDTWIVKDKSDPRIIHEEQLVHASAVEGGLDTLTPGAEVNKILCICNPGGISHIAQLLKAEFPYLSIVKSTDTLLELMQKGTTKSSAIVRLCRLWDIPLECTIAFGDGPNDVEMLDTVALPFLMANAPEDMKKRFPNITLDNDSGGIYHALVKTGLIDGKL